MLAKTIINKLTSRKLLVLVASTVMVFLGVLPVEDWKIIALGYVGAQGAVDALAGLRK